MSKPATRVTEEARAILDGAQSDLRRGEIPSMTWGVMLRLEDEYPDVLEAETKAIGCADWQDSLSELAEAAGWNASWDLHTLISGAAASARAQQSGRIGVPDLCRAAAAIIGGEVQPVGESVETVEEQISDSEVFAVPERLNGLVNDPLSGGCLQPLADVPEHRILITRIEQALLRTTSNKVVLVGERGVGKTALVRQLAERLCSGQVAIDANGVGVVSATSLLAKTGGLSTRSGGAIRNVAEQVARAGGLFCVEGLGDPLTRSQSSDTDILELVVGAIEDDPRPMLFTAETGCWGRETSNTPAAASRFEVIHVEDMGTESVEQVLLSARKTLSPGYCRPSDFIPREVIRAVTLQAGEIERGSAPGAAVRLLDRLAARAVYEKRRVTLAMLDEEAGIGTAAFTDGTAEEILGERVYGQAEAISKSVAAIAMRDSGFRPGNEKPVTILYCGPTGVGKTELAHGIAELVSGEVIRFDMAEFGTEGSVYRLLGAPPALIGHRTGTNPWSPLEANPNCVLLFDEIEKAHPSIIQLLLGPMDAGRLTLGTGQVVDLRRTVMIFTSNVELTGSRRMGFGGEEEEVDAAAALTDHFRPEWVNRLDAVCQFHPLSPEAVEGIIRSRLLPVTEEKLNRRGMELVLDPDVVPHIARLGHSERFGARELHRTYERELIIPLSRAVPRRTRNATVKCRLIATGISVWIE